MHLRIPKTSTVTPHFLFYFFAFLAKVEHYLSAWQVGKKSVRGNILGANVQPHLNLALRLLELCLTSHLQQKGLHVARTLVDVKKDRAVPLRGFNFSNEVYHLAAETVVALAKQVIDVTLLVLYEENHERVVGQARVIH